MLAGRAPQGLPASRASEQAPALPVVLVGALPEIVARVRAQRERYGFSYLTVLEPCMEAFAPVIGELRGA